MVSTKWKIVHTASKNMKIKNGRKNGRKSGSSENESRKNSVEYENAKKQPNFIKTKAGEFGSKAHKFIELLLNQNFNVDVPSNMKWIYKNFNAWKNEYNFKSFEQEKYLYSSKYGYGGTADSIGLVNENLFILDWKTSKKIDTKGFKNKKGTHPITKELQDCKFVHYSFQLSFYRYLLEEYYGLKISNQIIAHISDKGCVGLQGNYYQQEVVDMIEHHLDSLNGV